MSLAFDVISDLNVVDADNWSWEHKATSLYCIICGNISSNSTTVYKVLKKLSKNYLGVFYIGGSIEFDNLYKVRYKHAELARLCRSIGNVAYLHNHVVIVDGVAIIGAVGWNSVRNPYDLMQEILSDKLRQQDYEYLKGTIERLQVHMDVRKIIVATHCVPDTRLYFGQMPDTIDVHVSINVVLQSDTERKITHWVYGEHQDSTSIDIDGVTYINNACGDRPNYNAKRIEF